jgi:hypothetical protein
MERRDYTDSLHAGIMKLLAAFKRIARMKRMKKTTEA